MENGNAMAGACACSKKRHNKSLALLVLRVAIGVIFIVHGYGKLFGGAPGMDAFTGMVAGLGFPMPAFFAYAAALSEFLGGIALLLGIWTRVASVFLMIVMVVAMMGVKKFSLPQSDPDFTLFAIALAIYLMGPGKYSLAAKLGMKKACCTAGGGSCCKQEMPAAK